MFGRCSRLLAVVLLLLAPAFALVPAAHALGGTPVTVCVRPAQPGDDAAALLVRPDRFDCIRSQRSYGSGDFWLLSEPLALPAGPLQLRSLALAQQSTTLYVRYADGAIVRTGFDRTTAWRHLQPGGVFELPVAARAAPPVRLLWHVRGAYNMRAVVMTPRLATPGEAARDDMARATLYAVFGGVCLALVISNLALWGATRQRIHAPYCVMVLFMLAYGINSSGWLAQATAMDSNWRLKLGVVLMAGGMASAIQFARAYFVPAVFAGWLGRLTDLSLALLALATALYVVALPRATGAVDVLGTASFGLCVVLALPILWRAWRCDGRHAQIFALAWGAPLVLYMIRVVSALGMLPWNFWIENATIIAMGLEVALSGLVIAVRIQRISNERDEARAQETVARLLADTDPLTGLLNRRAFMREAIEGGAHGGRRLLALIDIDHFKDVNDTLGHDGGDEVLRVFARALRGVVPPDALVARVGGEEFAILAGADGDALPDAVLAAVRGARMPFDLAITASLGSGYGTIADDAGLARLYRQADCALYAAKHAGRDRVRWAEAA